MTRPIVQLANTKNLTAFYTVHETPIWRTRLWIYDYIKTLPFMSNYDGEFNRNAVTVMNLIIDYVELRKVNDIDTLRRDDQTWMLNPADRSELWIHFDKHKPPSSFASFKSGLLLGFSYRQAELLGNIRTYPLLLDIPDVEDKSDLISYQRMAFSSGKISIDNSSGLLDGLFQLFGGDMDLLEMGENNELDEIRQFYIESYNLGLTTATFNLKDKRARLSFNAPIATYNKEKYPFIDDNSIDKIQIDAYGYCRGVPGTCINRNQIYNPPRYIPDDGFNNYFEFKFARKITSIEEIWVNMSDVWTQIFPGLGIPGNDDPNSEDRYKNPNPVNNAVQLVYKDQNNNAQYLTITNANRNALGNYNNEGVIRIYHTQAMRDNPGHLDRRNGDANEVKMNGVFVDLHKPGDIIKDLLTYYGDLPQDGSYLNNEEWSREMDGMKQIGICLDAPKSVFDWIELIQNGSMLGFQLIISRNLFSARADNANREESFNIKWNEILNKAQIEPEISGENYATFATINYLKDYADDESLTVTDKTFRTLILESFRFEKEYANDSLISGYRNAAQTASQRQEQAAGDVLKKAKIILENYTKVRPIIRNIELEGLRWDSIKLFSTGFIDFTMELPRQMKVIQRYMRTRQFMQQLRVKVIGCKRNLKENKTYIDVIQCDKLGHLEDI